MWSTYKNFYLIFSFSLFVDLLPQSLFRLIFGCLANHFKLNQSKYFWHCIIKACFNWKMVLNVVFLLFCWFWCCLCIVICFFVLLWFFGCWNEFENCCKIKKIKFFLLIFLLIFLLSFSHIFTLFSFIFLFYSLLFSFSFHSSIIYL